jgi:hypothetical protein
MKRKILFLVIFIILADTLILFVDYKFINKNGFDIYLITALLTNSVTIFLYSLTYFLINKRTIGQSENQSNVAKGMMEESIKSVEEYMRIFTPEVAKKYIVPKLNFDDSFMNQSLFLNIVNKPFSFDNQIIELAKNGVIPSESFLSYCRIKQLFLSFINMTITMYDEKKFSDKYKKDLEIEIKRYREQNK